ncbi:hypothetical protein DFH07DRAFT_765256 [Mycena maculata]|uniref:Uncharacterized protein n=1 Tax=Mycena maculata TaxID=230809 RepID=A0AAD7NY50_9AGAR|nr:hypothetical protein DFH07DRAFT_765256 [Mycena maculata]
MLFDFELQHTPGVSHAPDGLSRRPGAPENPVEQEDPDDWIDRACRFAIVAMNWGRRNERYPPNSVYLHTDNDTVYKTDVQYTATIRPNNYVDQEEPSEGQGRARR